MGKRFPSVFVSHGAPSLILENCPTRDFFRQFGKTLGKPKAILSISAHWVTPEPMVTMQLNPPTIYDFSGFQDELYSIVYPATGDPVLAKRIIALLDEAGFAAKRDVIRGFDHGAWAPLVMMYPDADIPLLQLSVQPNKDAEYHLNLGKALQPLRDEGVLIIASGSVTHNLRDYFGRAIDSEPPEYVREFADWVRDNVTAGNTAELLDYLQKAPSAKKNHPTQEHFLPLFVAMAAGGKGIVLHDSYTFGVLSMMAFAWDLG